MLGRQEVSQQPVRLHLQLINSQQPDQSNSLVPCTSTTPSIADQVCTYCNKENIYTTLYHCSDCNDRCHRDCLEFIEEPGVLLKNSWTCDSCAGGFEIGDATISTEEWDINAPKDLSHDIDVAETAMLFLKSRALRVVRTAGVLRRKAVQQASIPVEDKNQSLREDLEPSHQGSEHIRAWFEERDASHETEIVSLKKELQASKAEITVLKADLEAARAALHQRKVKEQTALTSFEHAKSEITEQVIADM